MNNETRGLSIFRLPDSRDLIRLLPKPYTHVLEAFFSGQILKPERKRKLLIEKGVIDAEGYYLTPKEYNAQGIQIGGGNRYELEGCWIKPDFSDVDVVKSEFHYYKQSEATTETAKAMKRTGMSFDKWYYIVLVIAFVAMVAVVLITSGVLQQ